MRILSPYKENLQQSLECLNENQRKAVDQIQGPVLVIAGPGTGKTQILAARIGKILLETNTHPHNILCLTYTDAATIAMRKRLFDFIGSEAHRVHIYTFHAFCNDIIQENLDYFGKLALDPISDLERIVLLRKLVDAFPPQHPLKRFRGDAYYEVKRLQELFSIMKKESWLPAYINEKIDEFICQVECCQPDSPYYKIYKYSKQYLDKPVGSLKPSFASFCENLEKLRAAVNEFPKYQQFMQEANRYDYDDMILWVLEAFKKDKNFLLNYQERYHHVLVDEYQDTSGAQNALVRQLVSYWEKPNIFVVGDDDQSIYRFQGANVQNIQDYHSLYAANLYRVMLTDNYRSSQVILDLARELISHNQERVKLPGLSKHLIAKREQVSIIPQIRAYPSQFHEFAHLTYEVEGLIRQGVAPEDIAVIYKEHRLGIDLARYFQLQKIPVHAKRKVDVLKDPFGKKIIHILRYLALENELPFSGDYLLFEWMHSKFYRINPLDAAKISVNVSVHNKNHVEKTAIRLILHEISSKVEQNASPSESEKEMKRLSEDLAYLIKETNQITLPSLFEIVVARSGMLGYALQFDNKKWLMQILTSLFCFLKEECHKKPDLTLSDFIKQIDLLIENGLALELTQSIFNEKGVNFLTCHGSKGLEFEYVYLIGSNKHVWEKKRKLSTTYKFPDTLFSTCLSTANEEEELRRLFYVALTRAKKSLVVTYAEKDFKDHDLEPTLFIGEILSNAQGLKVTREDVPQETLINFLTLPFKEEEKQANGFIDQRYVEQLLEGYVLSVTHLNNYLDCPLKFYFQNLIQVPLARNESMIFGSAIHWALSRLFQLNKGANVLAVEKLIGYFEWYMQRHREYFTAEQFNRRMAYGQETLNGFYAAYSHQWAMPTITEYAIKNVEWNGTPIQGVLDKVELCGKQVNIVDYKTGNFENAKAKFSRPQASNSSGGDYWRQAVFYKLLLEADRRTDWKVANIEFNFVEPEKGVYLKKNVIVELEDIQIVQGQIQGTYQKIINQEFQGCGKEDCYWCNFISANA